MLVCLCICLQTNRVFNKTHVYSRTYEPHLRRYYNTDGVVREPRDQHYNTFFASNVNSINTTTFFPLLY